MLKLRQGDGKDSVVYVLIFFYINFLTAPSFLKILFTWL